MDERARKILLNLKWTERNGRLEPVLSESDFEHAKERGVLFEPFTIMHDECIRKIIGLVSVITPQQVGKAFLSSLSTRRLDWRSAIASYHKAKQMRFHNYQRGSEGYYRSLGSIIQTYRPCCLCERYGVSKLQEILDVNLSYESWKRFTGGVFIGTDPVYEMLDLELFLKEEIPEPTEKDIFIFREILSKAESCAPGASFGKLRDMIKDIAGLKSNKFQRSQLLDILAFIGVLRPSSFDNPCSAWCESRYIMYWRGGDGYNSGALNYYFPTIYNFIH